MTTITSQQTVDTKEQYSLAKILGIWAAVVIPSFIMAWLVFPAITPDFATDPMGAGYARMGALTVALAWLFVFSLIIVYREEGDLRWGTVKGRLRLNTPLDPKSGEPRRVLWWWLVPLVILHAIVAVALLPMIDEWVSKIFPFIAPPPGYELGGFLQSPDAAALFKGAWGILLMFLVMAFFNIFGEEFLFRGVLLPRMNGVFGRWDWVANGVLGILYHVSMPWTWLGTTGFTWIFFYALPAKYFRTTWFSIIIHGSINVLWTVFFLALIL